MKAQYIFKLVLPGDLLFHNIQRRDVGSRWRASKAKRKHTYMTSLGASTMLVFSRQASVFPPAIADGEIGWGDSNGVSDP